MKMTRLFSLLGAMTLFVGAALPAGAQTSADVQQHWLCKMNIKEAFDEAGVLLPTTVTQFEFETTNTRRQCPGNTSTGGGTARTTIDCTTEDRIPGWSGPARRAIGFECKIFRNACDLPGGFATTFDTQMNINSKGIATLTCICDPDAPSTTCNTGPN